MTFLRIAYFAGATREHFERLAGELPSETPRGRLVFAAGPVAGGWQVVQLWLSRDLLDTFNRDTFFPGLGRLGASAFPSPPVVTDVEPAMLSLDLAGTVGHRPEGALPGSPGEVSAPGQPVRPRRLSGAVVVRVEEHSCHVVGRDAIIAVDYAPQFPSPRLERVSPGHLVALAPAPDGRSVALWRWYDAVVIAAEGAQVRLWEPAHGEVLASARHPAQVFTPGTRAYLSAGLPGADWWVAGPVDASGIGAVELDEVEQLYTRYDLWERALG